MKTDVLGTASFLTQNSLFLLLRCENDLFSQTWYKLTGVFCPLKENYSATVGLGHVVMHKQGLFLHMNLGQCEGN